MKKMTDGDISEPSVRFKRAMNRIFREVGGFSKIPHPEVDNWFQRIRSRLIVKFHLKPYDAERAYRGRRR